MMWGNIGLQGKPKKIMSLTGRGGLDFNCCRLGMHITPHTCFPTCLVSSYVPVDLFLVASPWEKNLFKSTPFLSSNVRMRVIADQCFGVTLPNALFHKYIYIIIYLWNKIQCILYIYTIKLVNQCECHSNVWQWNALSAAVVLFSVQLHVTKNICIP